MYLIWQCRWRVRDLRSKNYQHSRIVQSSHLGRADLGIRTRPPKSRRSAPDTLSAYERPKAPSCNPELASRHFRGCHAKGSVERTDEFWLAAYRNNPVLRLESWVFDTGILTQLHGEHHVTSTGRRNRLNACGGQSKITQVPGKRFTSLSQDRESR